jgi:DNA replication protein DnaC
MRNLERSIESLRISGVVVERKAETFSVGNVDLCKKLLSESFKKSDKTTANFQWLPEYNEIVEWMSNTNGKGLLLMGDCGRGKSTILCSIIPLIFHFAFNKIVTPYSAKDLNLPDLQHGKKTIGWSKISVKWCLAIDEVGTEEAEFNFGERYEPFNKIIDDAENSIKLVFISTNLTKEQLLQRYGERTYDRLIRLCRVVEFKGPSLRK